MLWCLVCKSNPFFRVGKPQAKESETLSQNVVIIKRIKLVNFEISMFDDHFKVVHFLNSRFK